jgi:hypothetical protein
MKTITLRNTVEFCNIGYNDACIYFLLQFNRHELDVAKKCIASVTEYNEYKGKTVAAAFAKVQDSLYRAAFGREGSPVLYLTVQSRFWDKEKEEWIEDEAKALAAVERIKAVFKKAEADEIDSYNEASEDSKYTVRLWWD